MDGYPTDRSPARGANENLTENPLHRALGKLCGDRQIATVYITDETITAAVRAPHVLLELTKRAVVQVAEISIQKVTWTHIDPQIDIRRQGGTQRFDISTVVVIISSTLSPGPGLPRCRLIQPAPGAPQLSRR